MADQIGSRKLLTSELKELSEAIKGYRPKSKKRIGEILMDMDAVEEGQLREGLEKQRESQQR